MTIKEAVKNLRNELMCTTADTEFCLGVSMCANCEYIVKKDTRIKALQTIVDYFDSIESIEPCVSYKEKDEIETSRLDDAIANIACILDNLVVLRDIEKTGCCNDCAVRSDECMFAPQLGQVVRYNCPFYRKMEEE